jgi:phage tail sheath protein FI
MPSYSTPGVYIEEIPVFPPSVAPVATAIPAFIGYTEKAVGKQGEDLKDTAVRITSLLEYETLFGNAPVQDLSINVKKRVTESGGLLGVDVTWNAKPSVPAQFMYYSMRLYFANGGGPCYIYSVGPHGAATKAAFEGAITALEAVDEPTLLVFPDAVKLSDANHGSVVDAALTSCNKTQDRFTIADVRDAIAGQTDDNAKVTTNFRARVTKNATEFVKYGAAYFPYLSTNIPFRTADANVTLALYNLVTVKDDGSTTDTPVAGAAGKKLDDGTLDLANKETAVHAAIKAFIGEAYVTLPPSGAMAGVYARVDRSRGVWKAPANVGLSLVLGPAVKVTNDLQDGLNVDATTGKSVNALRAFFGKGTLVWGARTLAGNDNEWRYVSVRRFANFVEESVKKATGTFVFEPNDASTWVKVQTMIENFLINQWRDGALMGAKPEDAFKVVVGLGKTMSPNDILNGLMIVEVHLAIVRPAEFIVLRIMQKMPESG